MRLRVAVRQRLGVLLAQMPIEQSIFSYSSIASGLTNLSCASLPCLKRNLAQLLRIHPHERMPAGLDDLAEHFDDQRLGNRRPLMRTSWPAFTPTDS
jgi:hypothetical protein